MRSFALASASLCHRECLRFFRDRARALSSIVTAVLFWLLIGFGLGGSFAPLGMPQDMADAILFLASDRASYVNGDEITVDGGYANMLMNLVPRPGFE